MDICRNSNTFTHFFQVYLDRSAIAKKEYQIKMAEYKATLAAAVCILFPALVSAKFILSY